MAENSKIEWTHHTFNAWWGCVRVSPACENCYAESLAKRYGFDVWGVQSPRRKLSDKYWGEPLKWNKAAATLGERQRVFCSSMADVFEFARDAETQSFLNTERSRLWTLIDNTPHLDWLLLTKRPENVIAMVPEAWRERLPRNVWIGTTVEDQRRADERIPYLLSIPASVRFLSCEPLLESVNLHCVPANCKPTNGEGGDYFDALDGSYHYSGGDCENLAPGTYPTLDWVICGGETQHGARPMQPEWARKLRDDCVAAGVPFFFKQWGDHNDGLIKVGKKAAGRLLDGREWNEFPVVAP